MMEENGFIDQFDVMDNIPSPILLVNLETGNVKYCNKHAASFLGYDQSNIIDKNIANFYTQQSETLIPKIFKNTLKDGQINNKELTVITSEGREIPILQNVSLKIQNSTKYGVLTWQDIQEQYKLLEEHIQIRYQFEELFEQANFAISLTTLDEGKLIMANPEYKQLFGITPTNLEQFRSDMIYKEPGERDKLVSKFKDGGRVEEYQLKLQNLDGISFWAILSLSLVPYQDEKVLLSIINNVDEMKRLEYALKESNQDLENFAYIASHDLQQPLRTIKGFVTLLEKDYKDLLDDEGIKFLNFINSGIETLQDMIDGLLRYSRIGANELDIGYFSPSKVIEEVEQRLHNLIKDTGTEITVKMSEIERIQADREMFSLVMQNLISNAIKYHGDKPPQVKIKFQNLHDGSVKVEVEDQGLGIEAKHQEEIFDMFSRLHSKNEISGSGLGLSIVRRIIGKHHGKIGVKSTFGEGSTFWFTLPQGI